MIKLKSLLPEKYQKKETIKEMDAPALPPPAHVRQDVRPVVYKTINIENMYLLASTLWLEARGEGEKGMHSVMNVIMNRAGNNFEYADDVVLKHKQISAWNKISNPKKYSVDLTKKLIHSDDEEFRMALDVVEKARNGQLKDITGGAKFYVNLRIAKPSWIRGMKKTAKIGRHTFYK